MKVSTTTKVALGAALLVPVVMYAGDGNSDVIQSAANTLSTNFVNNPGTKKLVYAVEGAMGLGTYLWQRNWMTLAGLGVVFLYTNILTGIM